MVITIGLGKTPCQHYCSSPLISGISVCSRTLTFETEPATVIPTYIKRLVHFTWKPCRIFFSFVFIWCKVLRFSKSFRDQRRVKYLWPRILRRMSLAVKLWSWFFHPWDFQLFCSTQPSLMICCSHHPLPFQIASIMMAFSSVFKDYLQGKNFSKLCIPYWGVYGG